MLLYNSITATQEELTTKLIEKKNASHLLGIRQQTKYILLCSDQSILHLINTRQKINTEHILEEAADEAVDLSDEQMLLTSIN